MPAVKDPSHPRAFVKSLPLPIESQTGLKLQRRDSTYINPEYPTRDEVRRRNYERRQNQMATMGFKSLSHKPYVGIGDPFYLDQKKLILHALGQWDEEDHETSSSSEESEEEEDASRQKSKPSFAVAKFVLRRSRKDLNTINKAVVHGRGMIRNVQLGHSLFDLINKEKQRKKAASELELRKKRELQRNEFQPPKTESEDETDDELENDVDLTNYMVPLAPPTFLTQVPGGDTDEELGIVDDETASDHSPERETEIITFSGAMYDEPVKKKMARAEDDEEWHRSRSAAVTSEMTAYSRPESVRKKKQQTPRPYTPQHTNLSANLSVKETEEGEEELDISRDALFRQLCVLHWILEAMSTDPPSAMSPITSCWSLTEIGGSRPQPNKLKREKNIETNWSSFVTSRSPGKSYAAQRVHIISPNPNSVPKKPKVTKRMSTQRQSKSPHTRRSAVNISRNSITHSIGGGKEGGTTVFLEIGVRSAMRAASQLPGMGPTDVDVAPVPAGLGNLLAQIGGAFMKHKGDDSDHPPTPHSEDSDQPVNKSIFKFLDEYYESLKREEEQEKDAKSSSPTPSTTSAQDQKQKKEKRHKSKEERERKKSKKKKEEPDQPKRLDHKVAVALGEEEKMSSKYLRANAHLIRPKSSPALIEFQSSLPSSRHGHLCAKLHNQFAETREEKACTMHDILDHKEKQMMSVCQSKFVALQETTHGSSFHRAVDEMRHMSWQRLRKPLMDRRKTTTRGNWYMDIMEKIPHELKQEWHYAKILEKLGKFGLVEGTGKQTIYKFLRVLEGLREWEICSPDVTAAIEFCRERIIEMTVEEYEWWFKERFPKVSRPHTAPPSSKTEKKEEGWENSQNVAPKRAVQSAFMRRVQR